MERLYTEIPSLDLAHFTKGTAGQRMEFVQMLGKAYTEIGFVALKNHGLDDFTQNKLYESVEAFFQLPDAIKQRYENPELKGQRGYIGKMKEHAQGRTTPDLKEFFHVGQTRSNKYPATLVYPSNIFPGEVPELETFGVKVFSLLEQAAVNMLRAIALYLALDEFYFDDKVRGGNSILRPIHYFPILDPDSLPVDAVRAARHTDINLITLLMGASADGLEVLRHDGVWIPITALPEQIVVNVGDMLSRHTNNKLKSTVHRVVNPPRGKMHESRFSIPFFTHPHSEMDLSCLPSCIDEAHPKLFADITAGDFLDQRLAEIGF